MKKHRSSLAVGFPTIVNILVLLAFTCLALLSLSRAKADQMAASHGWDISSGYFQADSHAQQLLGAMEENFALPPGEAGIEIEAWLNDQGVAAFYDQAAAQLSFTLPAGEAGTLQITLRLLPGQFEIVEWRLAPHESEKQINRT